MRDIDREHKEIGKMLCNLLKEEKNVDISFEMGQVYINETLCIDNFYEELKQVYLKAMGHEETENVKFDLSPEHYKQLCEDADKEGLTIDEYAIKVLGEYLN